MGDVNISGKDAASLRCKYIARCRHKIACLRQRCDAWRSKQTHRFPFLPKKPQQRETWTGFVPSQSLQSTPGARSNDYQGDVGVDTGATYSLQLPQKLGSALKDALTTLRKADTMEGRITAQVESLDGKIWQLNRSIVELDCRTTSKQSEGLVPNQDGVSQTRREIEAMRQLRAELEERQEQLDHDLAKVYKGKTTEQADIRAALDKLLVINNLLAPQPQAQDIARPSGRALTSERSGSHMQSVDKHDGQNNSVTENNQPPTRHFLQRSAGSQDLQKIIAASAAFRPASKSFAIPPPDPQEEALRTYKIRKLFLGQAEVDFEGRQEKFDQQRDEFLRTHQGSSNCESMMRLDHEQLIETRELTRALAEAELEYYTAKDAAVAKGVHLGPDIESGFVDDPEDDYTLSQETETQIFADSARVKKWLNGVLDTERMDKEGSELEDINWPDLDTWDAHSVDICDSISMRAEWPWRRRIEKWRAACS